MLHARLDLAYPDAFGTLREAFNFRYQLGPIRAHQFSGGGGRGCALVGDEIGDGEIRFMSDAAHDGNRTSVDRARDDFFVEFPQVFDAATPTTED